MTVTLPIQSPIKRVVTCQGSIQLVTALSVLFHREQAQAREQAEFENYLVIYDLCAPEGQADQFAAFVTQVAIAICPWTQIVYLTPEQMQTISHKLNSAAPRTIFSQVHRWVGTETASEIYLCRNWQFGNQLLSNAYQTAEKICYGDSIGIYFSATSAVVPQVSPAQSKATEAISFQARLNQLIGFWRYQAGMLRQHIRKQLGLYTVLKTIEFDRGYFVLPTIMGEIPPMPTVQIEPETLLNVFQKLAPMCVNAESAEQLRSQVANAPVFVLLTSNLSEAGRLSREHEILAYRRFLLAQAIPPETVLIIKPHPRDNLDKLHALKVELAELFSEVIVLTAPELFFLPFEIFLLSVLLDRHSIAEAKLKVFAVSSAALSLKLLFQVPVFVGFGADVTSRLFDASHVAARLEHEQMLEVALQQLDVLPAI